MLKFHPWKSLSQSTQVLFPKLVFPTKPHFHAHTPSPPSTSILTPTLSTAFYYSSPIQYLFCKETTWWEQSSVCSHSWYGRSEGQEEDREKWGAGGGQRSEGQEEDKEKWGAGGGQREVRGRRRTEKWGAGGGQREVRGRRRTEKWGAGGGQRGVRGRRRTERSEGQEEDG